MSQIIWYDIIISFFHVHCDSHVAEHNLSYIYRNRAYWWVRPAISRGQRGIRKIHQSELPT